MSFPGLRASSWVVNSPPPAGQRQQTIAVAESLAGALPVLLRPLPPTQNGETVSKERLRFDTRQIEPQRKIALGNINTLTSALKLFDVRFSNCPQTPAMVKDSCGCPGSARRPFVKLRNGMTG